MTKIPFVKMQAAGNDFVLIDEFKKGLVPKAEKPKFVRRVSDRHFGIGSDGAIFVQKSKSQDARFLFYNPDGSLAEMCGNGIRCFAKYIYESGIVAKERMKVQTDAGLIVPEVLIENGAVKKVKVDMGKPEVGLINESVTIEGFDYRLTSVSMGNPHAVLFYDDITNIDIKGAGRMIRNCNLFKNGTNVHFVQKTGESQFRIRSYERGVEDETLACGTGICASAVAAVLNKKAKADKIMVFHAHGGDIEVELKTDGAKIPKVYLIGGAEGVFRGEIEYD